MLQNFLRYNYSTTGVGVISVVIIRKYIDMSVNYTGKGFITSIPEL
jgi:hypothetical protein